jgi:uncharacterized protein (DUF1501 family)
MNRRNFIQTTGLASASLMLPKFLKAQEKNAAINSDKILVIVQLTGGNDGLNTVVPFENDLYYNARPNIAIQKKGGLEINESVGIKSGDDWFQKFVRRR